MVNNEMSEDMLGETGDGSGDCCTETSTSSSDSQPKSESSPSAREADEPASSADENVRLSPTSLYCSVPLNRDVQTIIDTFPKTEAEKAGKKTRKIPCLYCDRTFVADNLRQKHVERSHSIKQARRSSSRFQQSVATVSCLFCNRFTLTENKLNDLFQHLVTAHPTKYFGCLPCQERFPTLAQLEEHNDHSHGIRREVKVQSNEEVSDTKTNSAITDSSVVKTRHKAKIKDESEQSDETRPMLRRSRHKKISIKSTKLGIKRSARLQTKVVPNKGKKRPKTKARMIEQPKLDKDKEVKVSSTENPYPTFDAFYRVKKITDHSIDNLRITSLTFNDVFDQAFYNRIKCNIRENLLNHLDGKLFKNEESESRISNFEKAQPDFPAAESYGCEISLNAATPVATSLLTAQFGDDPESQIEYGSKASKKKSLPKQDEVHYKYFTRRKYQASILESKENRDLSKLDMWTQLVIKRRQQKILKETKSDREKLDYKKGVEYRAKKQNQELNRVLDRRGPFEDLKEEASKKAALEGNFNQEAHSDVTFILDDILGGIFSKVIEDVEVKTELTDSEIPAYLNLRKASLSNESYVDKSDKITLICSSQETENFEAPDISPKDKNALVELTGEWARSRLYICAACGVKMPNIKLLIDHKNLIHQNVWCQHYEFVGNQGGFYKHLSIPGLGKMERIETNCTYKVWKRSEARVCTKCKKQCNSLGELHRHVLECGEDWSWMLVRKKCKYKPFGAKTRKKRRGLFKRIIHKQDKPTDENREKKTYQKQGPRVKPSDADTIERMLANLPAKRATRKIMSLKDGFPKIGRKTNYKKKTPEAVNIKSKKQNMQMRRDRGEVLIQDAQQPAPKEKRRLMKCNPVNNLRKSVRNLNKVISSAIIDNNSTLMVKRKLKNAIQKQRLTRRSQQPLLPKEEEEEEVKKPSKKVKKPIEESDKVGEKEVRNTRSTSSLPDLEEAKIESPAKKKNKFGKKLMRTLSLRRTTEKPSTDNEKQTASVDNTKNTGKRKSKLEAIKNAVKKIRLVKENLRSQKQSGDVVAAGGHFLEDGASGAAAETVTPEELCSDIDIDKDKAADGEENKNETPDVSAEPVICDISEAAAVSACNSVCDDAKPEKVIPKAKLCKRNKGLNACIAMLTSKLQQKEVEDGPVDLSVSGNEEILDLTIPAIRIPEITPVVPEKCPKTFSGAEAPLEEKENIVLEQKPLEQNSPKKEEVRLEKVVDIIKCFEDMNSKENINGHTKKPPRKLGKKKKPGKTKLNLISENVIPSIEEQLNTAILEVDNNEVQRDVGVRKLGQRRTLPKRNTKPDLVDSTVTTKPESSKTADLPVPLKPEVKKLIKEPKLILDSNFKIQTPINFTEAKELKTLIQPLFSFPNPKPSENFANLRPPNVFPKLTDPIMKSTLLKDVFTFSEPKLSENKIHPIIKPPVMKDIFSFTGETQPNLIKTPILKDVFGFPEPPMIAKLFNPLQKINGLSKPRSQSFGVFDKPDGKTLNTSLPNLQINLDEPDVLENKSFTKQKHTSDSEDEIPLAVLAKDVLQIPKPNTPQKEVVNTVLQIPTVKTKENKLNIVLQIPSVVKSMPGKNRNEDSGVELTPKDQSLVSEKDIIQSFADFIKQNSRSLFTNAAEPVIDNNSAADLVTTRPQQKEKKKCKKKGKLKKPPPDDLEENFMEHKPLLDVAIAPKRKTKKKKNNDKLVVENSVIPETIATEKIDVEGENLLNRTVVETFLPGRSDDRFLPGRSDDRFPPGRSVDRFVSKPIEDILHRKSIEDILPKPIENSLLRKPFEDILPKSIGNILLRKPIEDILLRKPIEDILLPKPIEDILLPNKHDDIFFPASGEDGLLTKSSENKKSEPKNSEDQPPKPINNTSTTKKINIELIAKNSEDSKFLSETIEDTPLATNITIKHIPKISENPLVSDKTEERFFHKKIDDHEDKLKPTSQNSEDGLFLDKIEERNVETLFTQRIEPVIPKTSGGKSEDKFLSILNQKFERFPKTIEAYIHPKEFGKSEDKIPTEILEGALKQKLEDRRFPKKTIEEYIHPKEFGKSNDKVLTEILEGRAVNKKIEDTRFPKTIEETLETTPTLITDQSEEEIEQNPVEETLLQLDVFRKPEPIIAKITIPKIHIIQKSETIPNLDDPEKIRKCRRRDGASPRHRKCKKTEPIIDEIDEEESSQLMIESKKDRNNKERQEETPKSSARTTTPKKKKGKSTQKCSEFEETVPLDRDILISSEMIDDLTAPKKKKGNKSIFVGTQKCLEFEESIHFVQDNILKSSEMIVDLTAPLEAATCLETESPIKKKYDPVIFFQNETLQPLEIEDGTTVPKNNEAKLIFAETVKSLEIEETKNTDISIIDDDRGEGNIHHSLVDVEGATIPPSTQNKAIEEPQVKLTKLIIDKKKLINFEPRKSKCKKLEEYIPKTTDCAESEVNLIYLINTKVPPPKSKSKKIEENDITTYDEETNLQEFITTQNLDTRENNGNLQELIAEKIEKKIICDVAEILSQSKKQKNKKTINANKVCEDMLVPQVLTKSKKQRNKNFNLLKEPEVFNEENVAKITLQKLKKVNCNEEQNFSVTNFEEISPEIVNNEEKFVRIRQQQMKKINYNEELDLSQNFSAEENATNENISKIKQQKVKKLDCNEEIDPAENLSLTTCEEETRGILKNANDENISKIKQQTVKLDCNEEIDPAQNFSVEEEMQGGLKNATNEKISKIKQQKVKKLNCNEEIDPSQNLSNEENSYDEQFVKIRQQKVDYSEALDSSIAANNEEQFIKIRRQKMNEFYPNPNSSLGETSTKPQKVARSRKQKNKKINYNEETGFFLQFDPKAAQLSDDQTCTDEETPALQRTPSKGRKQKSKKEEEDNQEETVPELEEVTSRSSSRNRKQTNKKIKEPKVFDTESLSNLEDHDQILPFVANVERTPNDDPQKPTAKGRRQKNRKINYIEEPEDFLQIYTEKPLNLESSIDDMPKQTPKGRKPKPLNLENNHIVNIDDDMPKQTSKGRKQKNKKINYIAEPEDFDLEVISNTNMEETTNDDPQKLVLEERKKMNLIEETARLDSEKSSRVDNNEMIFSIINNTETAKDGSRSSLEKGRKQNRENEDFLQSSDLDVDNKIISSSSLRNNEQTSKDGVITSLPKMSYMDEPEDFHPETSDKSQLMFSINSIMDKTKDLFAPKGRNQQNKKINHIEELQLDFQTPSNLEESKVEEINEQKQKQNIRKISEDFPQIPSTNIKISLPEDFPQIPCETSTNIKIGFSEEIANQEQQKLAPKGRKQKNKKINYIEEPEDSEKPSSADDIIPATAQLLSKGRKQKNKKINYVEEPRDVEKPLNIEDNDQMETPKNSKPVELQKSRGRKQKNKKNNFPQIYSEKSMDDSIQMIPTLEGTDEVQKERKQTNKKINCIEEPEDSETQVISLSKSRKQNNKKTNYSEESEDFPRFDDEKPPDAVDEQTISSEEIVKAPANSEHQNVRSASRSRKQKDKKINYNEEDFPQHDSEIDDDSQINIEETAQELSASSSRGRKLKNKNICYSEEPDDTETPKNSADNNQIISSIANIEESFPKGRKQKNKKICYSEEPDDTDKPSNSEDSNQIISSITNIEESLPKGRKQKNKKICYSEEPVDMEKTSNSEDDNQIISSITNSEESLPKGRKQKNKIHCYSEEPDDSEDNPIISSITNIEESLPKGRKQKNKKICYSEEPDDTENPSNSEDYSQIISSITNTEESLLKGRKQKNKKINHNEAQLDSENTTSDRIISITNIEESSKDAELVATSRDRKQKNKKINYKEEPEEPSNLEDNTDDEQPKPASRGRKPKNKKINCVEELRNKSEIHNSLTIEENVKDQTIDFSRYNEQNSSVSTIEDKNTVALVPSRSRKQKNKTMNYGETSDEVLKGVAPTTDAKIIEERETSTPRARKQKSKKINYNEEDLLKLCFEDSIDNDTSLILKTVRQKGKKINHDGDCAQEIANEEEIEAKLKKQKTYSGNFEEINMNYNEESEDGFLPADLIENEEVEAKSKKLKLKKQNTKKTVSGNFEETNVNYNEDTDDGFLQAGSEDVDEAKSKKLKIDNDTSSILKIVRQKSKINYDGESQEEIEAKLKKQKTDSGNFEEINYNEDGFLQADFIENQDVEAKSKELKLKKQKIKQPVSGNFEEIKMNYNQDTDDDFLQAGSEDFTENEDVDEAKLKKFKQIDEKRHFDHFEGHKCLHDTPNAIQRRKEKVSAEGNMIVDYDEVSLEETNPKRWTNETIDKIMQNDLEEVMPMRRKTAEYDEISSKLRKNERYDKFPFDEVMLKGKKNDRTVAGCNKISLEETIARARDNESTFAAYDEEMTRKKNVRVVADCNKISLQETSTKASDNESIFAAYDEVSSEEIRRKKNDRVVAQYNKLEETMARATRDNESTFAAYDVISSEEIRRKKNDRVVAEYNKISLEETMTRAARDNVDTFAAYDEVSLEEIRNTEYVKVIPKGRNNECNEVSLKERKITEYEEVSLEDAMPESMKYDEVSLDEVMSKERNNENNELMPQERKNVEYKETSLERLISKRKKNEDGIFSEFNEEVISKERMFAEYDRVSLRQEFSRGRKSEGFSEQIMSMGRNNEQTVSGYNKTPSKETMLTGRNNESNEEVIPKKRIFAEYDQFSRGREHEDFSIGRNKERIVSGYNKTSSKETMLKERKNESIFAAYDEEGRKNEEFSEQIMSMGRNNERTVSGYNKETILKESNNESIFTAYDEVSSEEIRMVAEATSEGRDDEKMLAEYEEVSLEEDSPRGMFAEYKETTPKITVGEYEKSTPKRRRQKNKKSTEETAASVFDFNEDFENDPRTNFNTKKHSNIENSRWKQKKRIDFENNTKQHSNTGRNFDLRLRPEELEVSNRNQNFADDANLGLRPEELGGSKSHNLDDSSDDSSDAEPLIKIIDKIAKSAESANARKPDDSESPVKIKNDTELPQKSEEAKLKSVIILNNLESAAKKSADAIFDFEHDFSRLHSSSKLEESEGEDGVITIASDDDDEEEEDEEDEPITISDVSDPKNESDNSKENHVINSGKPKPAETSTSIDEPEEAFEIPNAEVLSNKINKKQQCKKRKPKNLKKKTNVDIYCEICDKKFVRSDSLIKHKRTLTHIAKLSEIEAREAEERAKREDEEIQKSILVPSPFSLKTNNDTLKLADIISDVLNKPVPEDNIEMQETKRYKSLGERKSFDSDSIMFNPPKSSSFTNHINMGNKLPHSTGAFLETQISLLENIIENKTNFQYIDDLSNKSDERCSSDMSLVSDIKQDDSNIISFSHNTSIVSSIIHSDTNFVKPSQYEEISEDTRNFDEQRARKALNRDEELFLECCSLLKSSSEVSDYSKKSAKTISMVSTYGLKPGEETGWLEHKNLIAKRNNEEYLSRPDTPIGDNYDDFSNSNTIRTEWNAKMKEGEFEDISLDSLTNSENNSNFNSFGMSFNGGDSNAGGGGEKGIEDEGKSGGGGGGGGDVEDDKFDDLMDDDCLEIIDDDDDDDEDEDRDAVEISEHIKPPEDPPQPPTATYTVPLPKKSDSDSSTNDSKKVMTKGAMKVFEGLKVSIPTEELDMSEVLNCSPTTKRQDPAEPPAEAPKTDKPEKLEKSQKDNLNRFGNKLGLKITKKRNKPRASLERKLEEDSSKVHDVYDFEETQDNTDLFIPNNLKSFRSQLAEKKVEESDLDCVDSFGAEAQSVSSFSTETESSLSTMKKNTGAKNITKKKCVIMGRIFKNAFKAKTDEIKNIPAIENVKLVENYVMNCPEGKPVNDERIKMTEQEMDLLFDKLLEENAVKGKAVPQVRAAGKGRPKGAKQKKRTRKQSQSSDDEFNLNKTPKKRMARKKVKDNGINLEQELKECMGVAGRKSQRKCTSGKQNVLVEDWSSDDSEFEAMLRQSIQQSKTTAKNKEKVKETPPPAAIEKSTPEAAAIETPISEEFLKEIVKDVNEAKPKPRRKSTVRKEKEKEERLPKIKPGTIESTLASNRRKRAAADTLYYWSSSSDDDSQNLIEVKSVRDEIDEDDDRPMQHGWIVGDSPKKLVTMLAQAKGKKIDTKCVKEQSKKRTTI